MPIIIRLQNLPMSANASNIRRFFSGLSIPEGGVHIVGGNDGDAFIAFTQEDDARKAMILDNQAINGSPIRLYLSSKSEMKTVIDSARTTALYGSGAPPQSQPPDSSTGIQSHPSLKVDDLSRQKSSQQSIPAAQPLVTPANTHASFANGSHLMQGQPALSASYSSFQYGYGDHVPRDDMQMGHGVTSQPSSDYHSKHDVYSLDDQYRRDDREQTQFTRPSGETNQKVPSTRKPQLPDPRAAASIAYGHGYTMTPTTKSPSVNEYPGAEKSQGASSSDAYWDNPEHGYSHNHNSNHDSSQQAYGYDDYYKQQASQPQPHATQQHYDYDRRSMPSNQPSSQGKFDGPFGSQLATAPPASSKPSGANAAYDVYAGYGASEESRRAPDGQSGYNSAARPMPFRPGDQPTRQQPPSRPRMGAPPGAMDPRYPRGANTDEEHDYPPSRPGPPERLDNARPDASRGYRGGGPPPRQPPPESREPDFSVRPPWLKSDDQSSWRPMPLDDVGGLSDGRGKRGVPTHPGGPLQQGPPPQYGFADPPMDAFPSKRRRPESYSDERSPAQAPPSPTNVGRSAPQDTDIVVRVSLHPEDVIVRNVFDTLRGVQIVPRFGVRMEEDRHRRPTGYVFVMLMRRDMLDRALACDGSRLKSCNDRAVRVFESSPGDFYRVTDSSFAQKAPPDVARKAVNSSSRHPPPHHDDGCLELQSLPNDTTEIEVCSFLGAPGLKPTAIVLLRSANRSTTSAAVKLPSASDIEILMSAKPRPFRQGSTLGGASSSATVNLTPISILQYNAYADRAASKRSADATPPKSETSVLPTPVITDVSDGGDTAIVTGAKVCLCVLGLSHPMQPVEVLNIFKTVLIPGNAVHMIPPTRTGALVDLISATNCAKAVKELVGDVTSGEKAEVTQTKAKQAHPNLRVEQLTREQFDQRVAVITGLPNPTPSGDAALDKTVYGDQSTTNAVDIDAPQHGQHGRPLMGGSHRVYPSEGLPNDYGDYRGNRGGYIGGRGGPVGRYVPPPQPCPFGRPGNDAPPYGGFGGRGVGGPPRGRGVSRGGSNGAPDRYPPAAMPGRRPPGGDEGGVATDGSILYLSNMPVGTSQEQVSEMLADFRLNRASVRMKRVQPSGQLTGDAMVTFESAHEAERAHRQLQGRAHIQGRAVGVYFDPV